MTRSFTLIYTLALLTLLTRIQLNLLGRRNYLSSVIALASHARHEDRINLQNNDDDRAEQSYGNDFETNRKFLTFSWWLLHRGWRSIMEKVEAAVTDVFGPLSPREELTIERLSYLLVEVRKKIEGESEEIRRCVLFGFYSKPCLTPLDPTNGSLTFFPPATRRTLSFTSSACRSIKHRHPLLPHCPLLLWSKILQLLSQNSTTSHSQIPQPPYLLLHLPSSSAAFLTKPPTSSTPQRSPMFTPSSLTRSFRT